MKITKQFKSETAHIVRNAYSTRCAYSVHGHSYIYEVTIEGDVDSKCGMVLDFKRLSPIKELIDQFDHSTILWSEETPEVKDFFIQHFERVIIMNKNPTAENMVRLFSKEITEWLTEVEGTYTLESIRIWETSTGSAEGSEYDEDDTINFISEGIINE